MWYGNDLNSNFIGTCNAFNGEKIKVGEWKPVDNCKLNCTCVQVEKNQFLECSPWCKQQRKVCKLGEKVEEEIYFEEVGKTGCKRCVAIVCDALSEYDYTCILIPDTSFRSMIG